MGHFQRRFSALRLRPGRLQGSSLVSSYRVKDDGTTVAERLKSRMQVKKADLKSPRGSKQRASSRSWHVTTIRRVPDVRSLRDWQQEQRFS